MVTDKIVVLIHVYDQADLLEHFFAWYTELGVDAFLVQDLGSTDGTQDILAGLKGRYPLEWFSLSEKNLRSHRFGNTGDEMALLAREKLDPKWLMMCDADEFLVLEHDRLRVALERAEARGVTSINIPCFNMTGRPLAAGGDAVASLSLRIVKPYVETLEEQVSGNLPRPIIFIRHQQKSIVLASAFAGYRAGSHGAAVRFGEVGEIAGARLNHYLFRGFDKFEQKVRNADAFLRANDHLPSWWAWHWRRWVRQHRSGELRAEYEAQFVSKAQERDLVQSGICVVDRDVADWVSTARPERSGSADVGSTEPAEAADAAIFQDWFICDDAFSSPEWIDASAWIAFAPFVFWLVQALRPRLILDIATEDGCSGFTFGQALEQSAAGGSCLTVIRRGAAPEPGETVERTVSDAQFDYMASRHRHHLRRTEGSIADALAELRDEKLDMISVDGDWIADLNAATRDRLIATMSDRGVILVHGLRRGADAPGVAAFWTDLSRGRPCFELYHGDGLGIVGVGAALPSALQRLFALPEAARVTVRRVYAALAAALPKRDGAEARHEAAVAALRLRIDDLARERGAFEGGCTERDVTIRALHREIETLRRERAAFEGGCAERDSMIIELRQENERHRGVIADLERLETEHRERENQSPWRKLRLR